MSRNLAKAAKPAVDDVVARLEEVLIRQSEGGVPSARMTFKVDANGLFFLVGPAGSGKTAVLDLFSFQALPSEGRMEVFGIDPSRLAPSERPRMRRRVGVIFQDQRLMANLDVFANVALAARVAGRAARDFGPEVSELLMWVGLGGRGSDSLSRLTESEKRRLCLARALINAPDLLVADDPTAGLSNKAARAILRLICDVNGAGTPVVIATRDRPLAMETAGFVYEMPARDAS